MATKYYTALNLQWIAVQGFSLESLATAPSSPSAGNCYYDTALGYPRVYTATGWARMSVGNITDADIAAGAAIQLSKLAVDPLARANHTGTQTASTISNFDTQVRTTRLDQMAAPTAAVSMNGQRMTNVADPTTGTDGANQQWTLSQIDARITGQDWKDSVTAVAASNISLTAPGATLDGVTLASGNRVLLIGQTTGAQNGIYVWTGASATLTRATDADTSAEVTTGMTVPVEKGTVYAGTIQLLTTQGAITLGTTALTFTQVGGPGTYTAGTGLNLAGNVFSLPTVTVALGGTGATSASGARTNLNVPQRGFSATAGAMTAGVGLAIAHGLGTKLATVTVTEESTGQVAGVDTVLDATNVTLTSAVSLSSGVLRVTVTPIS